MIQIFYWENIMHWIINKTINFFKKTPENPTALLVEKQDSLAAEVPVSLVYNGIAHTVMALMW